MKRTIEAWAVMNKKGDLAVANIEMWDGCGSPVTNAMSIYPSEGEALNAKTNAEIVRPCIITYTIPPKKKRR